VYGFNSALERCDDEFLSWIAVTAPQIEAAARASEERSDDPGLEGKDLGLVRAFPVPTDSLELARHVNEFLAERPAW
jgi:hypothetical protein